MLVHPEFPVLELGQQLGASRRLHPAPPFAPGSDLMSAASCQAPGRARTALTAEGAEGVLRAHVPASPPRAQRHSPMRACAPSRASRGVALVPPQGLLLLEARHWAQPSGEARGGCLPIASVSRSASEGIDPAALLSGHSGHGSGTGVTRSLSPTAWSGVHHSPGTLGAAPQGLGSPRPSAKPYASPLGPSGAEHGTRGPRAEAGGPRWRPTEHCPDHRSGHSTSRGWWGAGPHCCDGPARPRGQRCRRLSPLRPGPPPAPPAPGVLDAQQQDALAGPALELPQVRDDEGVKLPQLPGTWVGNGSVTGGRTAHPAVARRHLGPRTIRLSCPDRQTLHQLDQSATHPLPWASPPPDG